MNEMSGIRRGTLSLPDSNKLRVAFLGGSYESSVGRVHRSAIEMDQRFELVSGCFSRKDEANRTTALEYGIVPNRAYQNIEELIENEIDKIDAIIIMTPQDQHERQVRICLDMGLPVICEKSLVTSVEEAVAIKNDLSSNGGFLAVTCNYTGYPMVRELKQMVEQGYFGKIQQLHMEMPQEGYSRVGNHGEPVTPQEWRLRDRPIPTISLDLGVHLHMMAYFLTGEKPEEVVATSSSFGNFNQVVDNVSCLARYSNDLDCSIWYSKTALGYRNGLKLRIFGERNSAEWIQENPEYLYFSDNSGGKFIIDRASKDITVANQSRYTRFKAGHPAGFIEAFANYYFDVANKLRQHLSKKDNGNHGYVFGIDESLEGLRMLAAIAKSSIDKQWIIVE